MRLILFLFLILCIVGCTQTPCPTINCPAAQSQPQSTTVNQAAVTPTVQGLTIRRLEAGTKNYVYLVTDNKSVTDIYNCGSTAYGPLIADDIKSIIKSIPTLKLNNLYILDSAERSMGGCKEIIINFPEINVVYIYGPASTAEWYSDVQTWMGRDYVVYKNEQPYELKYNGNVIDFSKVDKEVVVTDGVTYQ